MMNSKIMHSIIAASATAASISMSATAAILRVDAEAPPGGNGQNWSNAFRFLSDAINEADLGDEIWVANGTYYPDRSEAAPNGTGNRAASFLVTVDGVEIYGGFQGLSHPEGPEFEQQLNQRNPIGNKPILSGDIGTAGLLTDNSYHVVRALNVINVIIDGFQITRGYANGLAELDQRGGGFLITGAVNTIDVDIVLANCSFVGNRAADAGGAAAMHKLEGERITARFYNCQFLGNTQNPSIANPPPPSPFGGGAIVNKSTVTELTNCTFSGNLAVTRGGAIVTDTIPLTGAIQTRVFNSTLSRNSSPLGSGGGIYNQGNLTVRNAIIWGNSAASSSQIFTSVPENTTVTDSDVQGGWGGSGNIQSNPLFLDDDGPDNIVGTIDDNLMVSGESPCINDGVDEWLSDSADRADLDGNGNLTEPTPRDLDLMPRAAPTSVDMGAHEFQSF